LSRDENNFLSVAANQLAIYLEREILRGRAIESEEIKKSEGLYRTILDSVSHEIKTPVTSIIGLIATLEDDNIIQDKSKRKDLINTLSDSADRLNGIVTNLLDMSRLTSGKLSIKKDWQDTHELINLCLHDLKEKLSGRPVKVEIDEHLPLIMIDLALFKAAVSNILINSIQYTPAGSPINIRALRQNNTIIISISDKGPGVKGEELSRIFEKFYRTKDAPPGGTGLGLAITKAIVEAHDGRIEALNRPEGGLETRITLPIQSQPQLGELPNE
jgi:two-component system sensor histidine kinase KdpD